MLKLPTFFFLQFRYRYNKNPTRYTSKKEREFGAFFLLTEKRMKISTKTKIHSKEIEQTFLVLPRRIHHSSISRIQNLRIFSTFSVRGNSEFENPNPNSYTKMSFVPKFPTPFICLLLPCSIIERKRPLEVADPHGFLPWLTSSQKAQNPSRTRTKSAEGGSIT